jgi:hypothetical protein
MEFSTLVGSFGVCLLLIAFILSLFRVISQDSHIYFWLNLAGAGLAAYASWLIHYIPFVVLECAWTLVAVAGLLKKLLNHTGGL